MPYRYSKRRQRSAASSRSDGLAKPSVTLPLMKLRWLPVIAVVVAAASSTIAVRYIQRQNRATANLAATLSNYEQSLWPGMSRKDAKDYLRTRGVTFLEQCCNGVPGKAFSVLIPVGQEGAHWYCETVPDYVSLEFVATEPHEPGAEPSNSDVLGEIHLTRGGCILL